MVELDEERKAQAAKPTHLYRHFSKDGELLYVGVSLSTLQRLGQHASNSEWYARIARVDIEQFPSREEALEAERRAIMDERPKHNIVHKNAASERARELEQELLLSAKEKGRLVRRVAYVQPVYKLEDAAACLGITKALLMKWVRENKIGHFFMPSRGGKPVPFISGWQLIEHIESVGGLPGEGV